MRLYNTVNGIQTEMETLYRNISGKPSFTAGERDIVYGAIIDAYLIVLNEYGLEDFHFEESDITADTTADTTYIDLDEYVFKIVPGSVRIPAENSTLTIIDEVAIFQNDPDASASGRPYCYSYKSSTDPNILRVRLYPTPDAVYTLNLQVMTYPTDAITNFPVVLMNVIKLKAKELACLNLGLLNLKSGFKAAYDEAIVNLRDGYDDERPRHVTRTFLSRPRGNIQSRISD